jgi:putative membrane-bound dehydrogenase-like protein
MLSLSAICSLFVAIGVSPSGQTAAVGTTNPSVSDTEPAQVHPSPVSPQQSLSLFQLALGLRIELVAAEPSVIDPVAVRFDENGQMWVAQMRDYPNGPAGDGGPASRISILQDRDHDGYFETSHVFADQLTFVTGLQPWRGGVIVTLAGRIAFLKDTDGDGRADQDETWYRGFAQENSQLRANHPLLALDNHIYIANGLRGGSVIAEHQPDIKPLSISGMDFRLDPLTRSFEAVTGNGQFGMTIDDYGSRFNCSNRNPLRHMVLEDRYLRRNPSFAVSSAIHDVAQAGDQSRVFPLSRAWTTSTLHEGQFTAACGATIYRADGLPEQYYASAIICEPTGNLLHAERLQPAGATFTSEPMHAGAELVASTDEWFRPVNLAVGPDGGLTIVDMYRAVIEHPEWMPDELQRRPDLRWGDDRGRIYRLVATDRRPLAAAPRLGAASSDQLVALLEHPGSWFRETAARLLLERQDRSAQPALERLAAQSQRPVARVAALWALDGLGMLSESMVQTALADSHPRVREQAIVLSERSLSRSPALRTSVVAMADDEDVRVRFQATLSLAPAHDLSEVKALARIGWAGAEDPWTRYAVCISAHDRAADLAIELLAEGIRRAGGVTDGHMALFGQVCRLVGRSGDDPSRARVLAALADLPDEWDSGRAERIGLDGVAVGLASRGDGLPALVGRLGNEQLKKQVGQILVRAADVATDGQEKDMPRSEAIDALGHDASYVDVLTELALGEQSSQVVRLRAITALSRQTSDKPWQALLKQFPHQSPAMRGAVLDALISRPEWSALLLDQIASGRIQSHEVDPARADQLLKHPDAAIRASARRLLADHATPDRKRLLAEYRAALRLPADAERGRAVFQQHCATCHRVDSIGVDVAPAISDSRTKTPDQLLTDILEPNRAIDGNYVSYSVRTTDGRALSGIIAAETGSSITFRQPENKEVTLLRDQIAELRSSGISLMPDGLEKTLSHQAMADLIAFLKEWRYLDGRTPAASPP